MQPILQQFADHMLVGPLWPATMLLALMMLYAVIAMFGLVELDAGMDFDVDLDVDVDPGLDVGVDGADVGTGGIDADGVEVSGAGLLSSLGALTVKWTNFGRIPIAIWGGVFTLAFWGIAYSLWHGFDSSRYAPTMLPSVLLTVRNVVISVAVTKFFTQPLVGKFDPVPGYDQRRIVGYTCEISSLEATPSHGQAKFRADAAPLLLNVRTDGATIPRGTEVRVVKFDPDKRIYTVTEITPVESQS